MQTTPDSHEPTSIRTASLLLAISALALYWALRIPHLGHLLLWDEAMHICSARAMLSVGQDDFSNWFWRHPPIYSLLTLMLDPMKSGFSVRVEVMNLVIGSINMGLLFILNRRLFGSLAAGASVLMLSVMTGSVFFDLWIKGDHPTVTMGLAALILAERRRMGFASLMAGLGFLCKTTSLFLYLPLAAFAAFDRRSRVPLAGRLAVVTLIPAMTSFWWFIVASRRNTLSSITTHLWFAINEGGSGWLGGAGFYLVLGIALLGVAGTALMLAGCARYCRRLPLQCGPLTMWPLLSLLPSLLLLTLVPSKVPWVVITLLPAVATLQGLGLEFLLTRVLRAASRPALQAAAALAAAAIIAFPLTDYTHEAMQAKVAPGQYRGAAESRSIASEAGGLIDDDDRLLLTSFHYWKGIMPGQMCPVFTFYFEPKPEVLGLRHDMAFEEFVQLIIEHRVNWAIVSPEPGDAERDVIGGFLNDARLDAVKLPRACIFNTAPLLEAKPSAGLDEVPEALE